MTEAPYTRELPQIRPPHFTIESRVADHTRSPGPFDVAIYKPKQGDHFTPDDMYALEAKLLKSQPVVAYQTAHGGPCIVLVNTGLFSKVPNITRYEFDRSKGAMSMAVADDIKNSAHPASNDQLFQHVLRYELTPGQVVYPYLQVEGKLSGGHATTTIFTVNQSLINPIHTIHAPM